MKDGEIHVKLLALAREVKLLLQDKRFNLDPKSRDQLQKISDELELLLQELG